MKKNKKVFLTILFLMVMIIMMLSCNNSYAVLQVNGSDPATQLTKDWIVNFRKMEALGGTLGLEETINDDLTSTESNNLDCHMIKNTEYGALAILSASSYGNPYRIEDGDTTTGNKTGVQMNINNEWTAAHSTNIAWDRTGYEKVFKDAKTRYINWYPYVENGKYQRKIGDALAETAGWHDSGESIWATRTDDTSYAGGFLRATNGSIFSYDTQGRGHAYVGYEIYVWTKGQYNNEYASRPVIVVGEGF